MDMSKELQDFRKTLNNLADLEFFDEFILPHSQLIFDSALRLSQNRAAGKELAQMTFFHAIKNSRQLEDAPKSQDWLFSILKTLFLQDTSDSRFEGKVVYYFHNEKEEEFEKSIPKGLDKLDDKLKKPIEMFYMEGLSYQQISEALNLPVGTVISRIARGKVHLARFISAD